MNQTSENREKPNLRSDFGTFDLNLSPSNIFRGFTSTRC